jgi:hypothetical protein
MVTLKFDILLTPMEPENAPLTNMLESAILYNKPQLNEIMEKEVAKIIKKVKSEATKNINALTAEIKTPDEVAA